MLMPGAHLLFVATWPVSPASGPASQPASGANRFRSAGPIMAATHPPARSLASRHKKMGHNCKRDQPASQQARRLFFLCNLLAAASRRTSVAAATRAGFSYTIVALARRLTCGQSTSRLVGANELRREKSWRPLPVASCQSFGLTDGGQLLNLAGASCARVAAHLAGEQAARIGG